EQVIRKQRLVNQQLVVDGPGDVGAEGVEARWGTPLQARFVKGLSTRQTLGVNVDRRHEKRRKDQRENEGGHPKPAPAFLDSSHGSHPSTPRFAMMFLKTLLQNIVLLLRFFLKPQLLRPVSYFLRPSDFSSRRQPRPLSLQSFKRALNRCPICIFALLCHFLHQVNKETINEIGPVQKSHDAASTLKRWTSAPSL